MTDILETLAIFSTLFSVFGVIMRLVDPTRDDFWIGFTLVSWIIAVIAAFSL